MGQIEISLNSQTTSIAEGITVREMISAHTGKEINEAGRAADGSSLGLAVAVNSAVIPRSSWNDFALLPGHQVELVTAAQGG